MLKNVVTLSLLSAITFPAMAHDTPSREEQIEALGWDFSKVEITSEQVADGLHVLYGLGGNSGKEGCTNHHGCSFLCSTQWLFRSC